MQNKPAKLASIRARAAALSALGLVGSAAMPAAPATAQAAFGSDIVQLTQNDARLNSLLAFHQSTALGAPEVDALLATNTRVCFAESAAMPARTLGMFTRAAVCRTETGTPRYRVAINEQEFNQNVAAAVQDFTARGTTADERSRLTRQAEYILMSLYLSNEDSAALQIQAGVQRLQNRMLPGARSDFAAVEIASEIASDARMLAQASNLVQRQGMPLGLVVRMLNVVFPDGEGGAMLSTYQQGQGAPGYDAAAQMAEAMGRLWNPTSGDQRISGRAARYLDRAYPQGRPEIVAAPISASAQTAINLAAGSSGVSGFASHLQRLSVSVSQAPELLQRPASSIPGLRGRIANNPL